MPRKGLKENIIFKLTNIFVVVPFYDFNKRKLTHKTLCKAYGILLTVTATITTFSYYFRRNFIHSSSLLATFQNLMSITSLLLFSVTALGSSFWNMKPWEEMLNLLFHTETHTDCTRRRFLHIPIILLLLRCLHGIVIYSFLLQILGAAYTEHFLHVLILHFSRILTIYIIHVIVSFIKNKYRNVNSILDGISCCIVIKNSTVKKLQGAQRIYLEADKLVQFFNKIFGWPMLLILAESMEIMLLALALFTEQALQLSSKPIVPKEVVLLNTFYTVMLVVSRYLQIILKVKVNL